MSMPFIGEIKITSFGFPEKTWALCNGQLLPIGQNQALFSLLGTTFGGDGRVNFGLPNLQGRVPMGVGNGHAIGEIGGEAAHTVVISELPTHIHGLSVQGTPSVNATRTPGATSYLTTTPRNGTAVYSSGSPAYALGPATIANTGGSQVHENRQPTLVLSFMIALQGLFPSQT